MGTRVANRSAQSSLSSGGAGALPKQPNKQQPRGIISKPAQVLNFRLINTSHRDPDAVCKPTPKPHHIVLNCLPSRHKPRDRASFQSFATLFFRLIFTSQITPRNPPASQQWLVERASLREARAPAARRLASMAPRSNKAIRNALACRYVASLLSSITHFVAGCVLAVSSAPGSRFRAVPPHASFPYVPQQYRVFFSRITANPMAREHLPSCCVDCDSLPAPATACFGQ